MKLGIQVPLSMLVLCMRETFNEEKLGAGVRRGKYDLTPTSKIKCHKQNKHQQAALNLTLLA